MTAKVRRPLVRWFGGKWRLAPWIIEHFPEHRTYVEPFGGGASVLLRKPRSHGEVYNDLDDEIVNLFEVLRDPEKAARFRELLRLTPYAKREFERSYERTTDTVERARRLVVLSFMGYGANAHARISTGFRANANRNGTTPAQDWANYPEVLDRAIARLKGVTFDSKDAKAVMAQHDGRRTLHYVDPPYIHSTRGRHDRQRSYVHEMSDADHVQLLAFLRALEGFVVLSAYPHPIYDDTLAGWRRIERETFADGARPRTEVLWLNPRCAAALNAGLLLPRRDDAACAAAQPPLSIDGVAA